MTEKTYHHVHIVEVHYPIRNTSFQYFKDIDKPAGTKSVVENAFRSLRLNGGRMLQVIK